MIEYTLKILEDELKSPSAMKRETARVVLNNLYFDSKWYELSLRRDVIRLLKNDSRDNKYN